MLIFKLHYDDYEESQTWLFSHEIQTNEGFESDVNSLLKIHGDSFIESKEGEWVGTRKWVEYIIPELKKIGYAEINPFTVSFSEGSILGECDKDWADVVGDELFYKALQHNAEVEKEHLENLKRS